METENKKVNKVKVSKPKKVKVKFIKDFHYKKTFYKGGETKLMDKSASVTIVNCGLGKLV